MVEPEFDPNSVSKESSRCFCYPDSGKTDKGSYRLIKLTNPRTELTSSTSGKKKEVI